MTVRYDVNFDPPAPMLSAILTSVVRRRPRMRLADLIDTGADMTAIPNTVVKRLRLYAVGRIEIEGVHARVQTVDIYTVQMVVAGQPPLEMEVVQTELPFVILGRDWLAHYYLLLNGPDQTLLLSDIPLIEDA